LPSKKKSAPLASRPADNRAPLHLPKQQKFKKNTMIELLEKENDFKPGRRPLVNKAKDTKYSPGRRLQDEKRHQSS